MSVTNTKGGVTVTWALAAEPRSFTSKTTQQPMTVVELRDPVRLGNSIVLFLDGQAEKLGTVPPGTEVTLHLEEVRAGRGRGELVGRASREDVEAAFSKAVTR